MLPVVVTPMQFKVLGNVHPASSGPLVLRPGSLLTAEDTKYSMAVSPYLSVTSTITESGRVQPRG